MQKTKSLYQRIKKSLELSNNGNPNQAIQVLKQVQRELKQIKQKNPQFIQQLVSIDIITHNNLACAYNKKKKFKSSLFNLQQVSYLQNEQIKNLDKHLITPQILNQIATTHSNLCAVYSQMSDHSKAIREIEAAINLLLSNQNTKMSQSLLVFYYNYAVQLQYIRDFQKSQKILNKALSILNQWISPNAREMRPLLDQCLERIRGKIKRRQQRVGDYLQKCIKGYRSSFKVSNIDDSISKQKDQKKLSLNRIHFRKNSTLDRMKANKIQNNQTYQPITTRNYQSQIDLYIPRRSKFPRIKLPTNLKPLKNFQNQKQQRKKFEEKSKTTNFYSMYQPKPLLTLEEKKHRKSKNKFLQQNKLQTAKQFSYKKLLEDL